MSNNFEPVIIGEYIVLRKVTSEDASDIYAWRSGISGRYLRQPEKYNIEMQAAWIASRPNDEINYLISDKASGEKVGTIGIYDVNYPDQVANVGRLLLSDKFLTRSNPYGLEALLLCYGYVFKNMHFRKITGDIVASNVAMVKLQKMLGMKQEGFLQKHVLINGVFEDLCIMSLFEDEFDNQFQKKIHFFLKAFKP